MKHVVIQGWQNPIWYTGYLLAHWLFLEHWPFLGHWLFLPRWLFPAQAGYYWDTGYSCGHSVEFYGTLVQQNGIRNMQPGYFHFFG